MILRILHKNVSSKLNQWLQVGSGSSPLPLLLSILITKQAPYLRIFNESVKLGFGQLHENGQFLDQGSHFQSV